MCQESGVKSVDGLGSRRVETRTNSSIQSRGCEGKPAEQVRGRKPVGTRKDA